MGWGSWSLPLLWSQAAVPAGGGGGPAKFAPLALERWCGGLTLSPPGSTPDYQGLWAWLAGLAGLLAVAVVAQGPAKALGQAFDLPGMARLLASAGARLGRAGRPAMTLVGLTVLSWTASQWLSYDGARGREDLVRLGRSRSPLELAAEQGALAALTPLRDVAGLGSNTPLTVAAMVLAFRAAADLWGSRRAGKLPHAGRANAAWSAAGALVVYRVVGLASGNLDLPPGGCLTVEALVVPAVMALGDGLLLGWVLAELRRAVPGAAESGRPDVAGALTLLPAASLACLAALPSRYLAAGALLASAYLPPTAGAGPVGSAARWLLSWGLADAQAAGLLVAGLAGAAAWTGGGAGEAVRGYGRLLAREGGRLAALFALAGLAAGLLSASAYLGGLALPPSTWLLRAADSYAHYATLPVGLLALSALVELGERALPAAELVPVAGPPGGGGPDA